MVRKRGPKNSVEKKPKELILKINQWLLDGKLNIAEIVELVNNHPLNDIPISSSSLNRYAKVFDKEIKDLADLDHLLKNLPKEINFDEESKIHKLVAQILSKAVLTFSMGKEDFDAKDLSFVAKALKDIMSSTKDREKIKADLRKEIEKEVKEAQADKLKHAKAGGKLSKKSFEDAMRILGL